jgi:hypothetical protein
LNEKVSSKRVERIINSAAFIIFTSTPITKKFMNLLNGCSFIRISGFVCVTLAFCLCAQAQANTDPKAYILKPNISTMTKAEFLSVDTISLSNCTGCRCYAFTIILADSKPLKYGIFRGNKIPVEFKNIVSNADSCTLTFDEIKASSRDGDRLIPPIVVKIK